MTASSTTSYRLKRRHFLQGIGALFGLRLMLDNVEAVVAGAPKPPRLLFVHWPGGTIHYYFKPQGAGTSYTTSRILQPFEDLGLRQDMMVIYGTNNNVGSGQGGGAEAGTVMMATGAPCPGTRANGGEEDDPVAGGPSFEQIFLRHVPGMRRPGIGSVNMTCDARVDSLETSSRCLSYSYDTQSVPAARPDSVTEHIEHVPLLPDESPFDTFTKLFEGFMPGTTAEEAANLLAMRRSVLDASLSDLARLRSLAPASERVKLDLHEQAIRDAERQLSDALTGGGVCLVPSEPDQQLVAKVGSAYDYNDPRAEEADDPRLEQMARLYFGLVRSAFQCDIVRAATFQWAPSTNHIAFQGLYPEDPEGAYMHHPLGSRIGSPNDTLSSPPTGQLGSIVEFLTEVNIWFNRSLGEALVELKNAEDPFGGNLLDATVVPYMTEKAEMTDSWSPMPSMLFGGRALGLQGGQYVDVTSGQLGRRHNSVWMTAAQALLQTNDPIAALSDEVFLKDNADPIPGLWVPS